MSFKISSEKLIQVYQFLKNFVYQENLNLFLKERLAYFELNNFEAAIEKISQVLNSEESESNSTFIAWLNKINYRVIPKDFKLPNSTEVEEKNKDNEGLFLSNKKTANYYLVEKINYFIDAPIELHITEVLWTILVGTILDGKLSKDCYGNRISDHAKEFHSHFFFDGEKIIQSTTIFCHYIDNYNAWRDQAIESAISLIKNRNNAAILSLDLKSYFYNIDIDFDELCGSLQSLISNQDELKLALKLTKLLQKIHQAYRLVIKDSLEITHSECINRNGIPIGFCSSSLLANWYLKNFDNEIADRVRPFYYARYVDDILLVFKQPDEGLSASTQDFVSRYLENIVITSNKDKKEYQLAQNYHSLPIQKDKLILHVFDKDHTLTGLTLFKQELEERSSAFKFLPDEHIEKDLDRFAYDLLYNGSANKFRSIIGLAENETELSKYLSDCIIYYRLCKTSSKENLLEQLKLFFKGKNALKYSKLWEKVYAYSIISQKFSFAAEFYNLNFTEIKKIQFRQKSKINRLITEKIIEDLHNYNKIALGLCLALLDISSLQGASSTKFNILDEDILKLITELSLSALVISLRESNLIRHSYVIWPLINYTTYSISLINDNNDASLELNICSRKQKLSPRFIHFDEWQLFQLKKVIFNKEVNLLDWQKNNLDEYKAISNIGNFPINLSEDIEKYKGYPRVQIFSDGKSLSSDSIRVAIANLKIAEIDIQAAIRKDMKPNISSKRQSQLYRLLNAAEKEEIKLLVLPEVSIPVSWLPFMVAHARRHEIALVFGLEHWLEGKFVYNLIIEALPFKIADKYKSCFASIRIKNHYSPKETELIESLNLKSGVPSTEKQVYHLIKWAGITFATYNCFELSDIQHRAIFRSEIDLLTACVYNPDTYYYEHILESAVRDLHCYVIQANASQFGGSCILQPTKHENMRIIQVKGGENSCILVTDLNMKELRRFQFKSRKSVEDKFKPLPPGYDSAAVLERQKRF